LFHYLRRYILSKEALEALNQRPVRAETDPSHKIDYLMASHGINILVIECHDERSCRRGHQDKPSQLCDEIRDHLALLITFGLSCLDNVHLDCH